MNLETWRVQVYSNHGSNPSELFVMMKPKFFQPPHLRPKRSDNLPTSGDNARSFRATSIAPWPRSLPRLTKTIGFNGRVTKPWLTYAYEILWNHILTLILFIPGVRTRSSSSDVILDWTGSMLCCSNMFRPETVFLGSLKPDRTCDSNDTDFFHCGSQIWSI